MKVETWGVYPKLHRQDFLGIFDYLAFNDAGEMIAIQTTTKPNVSTRRKKMLMASSFAKWTRGGRKSLLHGWYKERGQWRCHEEELTLKDWEAFQKKEKEREIDTNTDFYKSLFPNEHG